MRIRKLSEGTINRIAAGEVVERPASVVKELTENAIDAGASQIDIVFRGGGKSLIRVSDNGSGMGPQDLALALERHATSKLSDDALINIATLGFRGEALPSIASVSRMAIITRDVDDAHAITVEAGRADNVAPASRTRGTDVEVRDLFFATPARIKFLKTDRSETMEAADVVRRLALAHPHIGFSFTTEERRVIDAPQGESAEARVERIMGREFMANAVPVLHMAEDIRIDGYASLPTYARGQGTMQFAFVNGRPVRDKLVAGAIRGAYADVLPPGRFPAVVVHISCSAERVDVNVHPAKTEVRFRDQKFVRGLIVSAIRRALATREMKTDQSIAAETLSAFRPRTGTWQMPDRSFTPGFAEEKQAAFDMNAPPSAAAAFDDASVLQSFPLGVARGHLHGNYIVAQTERGMVLVDQHAAHERIVYERMKAERVGQGVVTQPLLVPQVVELDPATVIALVSAADVLAQGGLTVEAFGEDAVLVRDVPAALGGGDIPALLRDVADDVAGLEHLGTVNERINHVMATFACHHSVRSGRSLRPEEMNALLRQMEQTPNAGECNHGRPTFIELSLADIERLFGRR